MRGVQALPSLESGDTAAICAPELQNSLEEYEASMRAVAQVARGCVELQVRATERGSIRLGLAVYLYINHVTRYF